MQTWKFFLLFCTETEVFLTSEDAKKFCIKKRKDLGEAERNTCPASPGLNEWESEVGGGARRKHMFSVEENR